MRLDCNWSAPLYMRSLFKMPRLALFLLPISLGAAFPWIASAGVGGSISGTVKDPSGAAIVKASVTLINTGTGIRQATTADGSGTYVFPVLPVGNYVLEVNQPGFKAYRRSGIVLDTSSAMLLDVVLQVGPWIDVVTVSDAAAHLETSSSQMGEVINSTQMSAVPADGRSYNVFFSVLSRCFAPPSLSSHTR